MQFAQDHNWRIYTVVALLLTWYFVSSQSAVATKSVTFDETLHLTGGYSYWKFGDFRLHPENGNFPQRWATIPLYFGTAHFPELSADEWRTPNIWMTGEAFLYGSGNDADRMLMLGRAMIGLLGVSLGLLIYLWARSLLGTGPAFISLGLYIFCPSLLAHGGLATSDMAATLFFTAAALCIWRTLHVVNWQNLLLGAIVIGALFLSKFSAIVLLPIAFVLMVIQLISRMPTLVYCGRKKWEIIQTLPRLLLHLATFSLMGLGAILVIWGFYNFRYSMYATADAPDIAWDELLRGTGIMGRLVGVMRDWRLLPEGYLVGFANVLHHSETRAAFFNGDYRLRGWIQFFPYCVLVKTPLTLFALMGLAAIWIVEQWYASGNAQKAMVGSLYRSAPLWVLFVVYWLIAISSHLNIGHRHILPTYPPMLILAGGSWMWVTKLRAAAPSGAPYERDRKGWLAQWLASRQHPLFAVTVLASMISFGAESLSNWPNYLAYFNQLIGSHNNAYRHLVDSSLDWGQDLPALKQYLTDAELNDSHSDPLYLSYFGTGVPEYYGIQAAGLPGFWDRNPPRVPEPLQPGTYCISATILQGIYTRFPGRWNEVYEDSYQQLAAKVRQYTASDSATRTQLLAAEGESVWLNWFQTYEHARLARLTSFLRAREPDREINYSILIYRLTAEDLEHALNGPPIQLLESPDFSR